VTAGSYKHETPKELYEVRDDGPVTSSSKARRAHHADRLSTTNISTDDYPLHSRGRLDRQDHRRSVLQRWRETATSDFLWGADRFVEPVETRTSTSAKRERKLIKLRSPRRQAAGGGWHDEGPSARRRNLGNPGITRPDRRLRPTSTSRGRDGGERGLTVLGSTSTATRTAGVTSRLTPAPRTARRCEDAGVAGIQGRLAKDKHRRHVHGVGKAKLGSSANGKVDAGRVVDERRAQGTPAPSTSFKPLVPAVTNDCVV